MEVIILAGGLGTRLKSVVNDVPKPMAPIGNKPFLFYLLNWLSAFPISKYIFSTGYKSDIIQNYLGNFYNNRQVIYAIENEPLGTGGGIFNALQYTRDPDVLVINGDTFFPISLTHFQKLHVQSASLISIALKEMGNFDRYGAVSIDKENYITDFHEKVFKESGVINGGIYFIKKDLLQRSELPKRFSFETEVLLAGTQSKSIKGFIFDAPFIDIGIPEDYQKAKEILL